jgi:hypothetical protein
MRIWFASFAALVFMYACDGEDAAAPSVGAAGENGDSAGVGGEPAVVGTAGETNGGTLAAGGSPGGEPGGEGGAPLDDGNPIVAEETRFLDYGLLRVAFQQPVVADELELELAPLLPRRLAVTHIEQVDATTVDVSLGSYHAPRDYQLRVSGKLPGGQAFESRFTLPGEGNGARVAFITHVSGAGDFMAWADLPEGVTEPRAAADAFCQREGEAAGMRGKFVAFLSSRDDYDAGCRAFGLDGVLDDDCGTDALPVDSAPWLDARGLPLVNGATGLAAGELLNALSLYANGTRAERAGFWSGTGYDARADQSTAASADCVGFSSSTTPNYAEVTEFASEYAFEYREFASACSKPHGLFCLQVGSGFFGMSELHHVQGKRVFVSRGTLSGKMSYDGKTGVAAADALCQAEAEEAGFDHPERFSAFLGTSQTDALCHALGASGKATDTCGLTAFPTDAWQRADGYPLGSAAQWMTDGYLTAPILFAADGSRQADATPWTGVVDERLESCDDWSSDSAAVTGLQGSTRAVDYGFAAYTGPDCSVQSPVYCFEH